MKRNVDFDTDVLIIGGGAAGVEAAIKAVKTGVKVTLVDKNWFGKGGSSAILSSGWVLSKLDLKDIVAATNGLADQKLCEALSQTMNSNNTALETEKYGSLFLRQKNGKAFFVSNSHRNGYRLFNFVYEVLRLGVNVIEKTMATSLLTKNGEVVGATALNIPNGQFYVLRAKSVVLATGGIGEVFGDSGTTNASGHGSSTDRTGDGQVLAYRIGTELRNMEFRSLHRAWIYPPQAGGVIAYGTKGQVMDKSGNDIFKDVPQEEKTTQREMAETLRTIREGRGTPNGGVYVNYEPFLPDYAGEWVKCFVNASNVFAKHWKNNGIDTTRIETGWAFNMDQGGLVINEKAETTVPGLYACGETTGIGGPGHMNGGCIGISCITMGTWAGENAAKRAKSKGTPEIDWEQVENERERVMSLLTKEVDKPIRPYLVRRNIQSAAWKGAGPVRSQQKCEKALVGLDRIRKEDLSRMSPMDKSRICNYEWKEALEALNMIDAAEIAIRSALARTESRGTHLREEYENKNDHDWLKTVHIKNVEGRMTVFTKPVIFNKVTWPCDKAKEYE